MTFYLSSELFTFARSGFYEVEYDGFEQSLVHEERLFVVYDGDCESHIRQIPAISDEATNHGINVFVTWLNYEILQRNKIGAVCETGFEAYTGCPKKVSHYQESKLNRIKSRQCGYILSIK